MIKIILFLFYSFSLGFKIHKTRLVKFFALFNFLFGLELFLILWF